jgi:S1-C subfamily serine protease/Flp pilus assembly protein TadD
MLAKTLPVFFLSASLVFVEFSAAQNAAGAPQPTLGESIYKSVSEAVFLVEVLDQGGNVTSVGSAFLIGDQLLVTNHHVVASGRPHLRVGSVRFECTIDKIDQANDLALLRVHVSIASQPLVLAQADPSAGATIFAIGNPAGLERTISQGLVSGRRQIDGQSLLQISASISPGSSGGPVVNDKGEVVGAAVGYLESGQNLNFAVPVERIIALLKSDRGSNSELDSLLQQALKVDAERRSIDSTEYERWRAKVDEVGSILEKARELASDSPERLLSVAKIAEQVYHPGIAIKAAQDFIRLTSTPDLEAHRILARMLQTGVWLLEQPQKDERLTEALTNAQIVVSKSARPTADDFFQLALILEEFAGRQGEAYASFQRALAAARKERISDLRIYFRGLFRTSKEPADAASWFKQIIDNGGAEEFDWSSLAERLYRDREFQRAGDAWLRAAEFRATTEYLCQAGFSYWSAELLDNSLSSFRKCTEVAAREESAEARLANAYSVMSSILFRRGVYEQSISYAKQALALSPEDSVAYHNLSRSLRAVGRSAEAAAAAEAAIRLSDGRWSDMHFALGAAYFDLENWNRAALAFEKAAELDPQDSAAAFNAGLSMQRQGFSLDAAKWYKEALRRNPSHPDKDQILRTIRVLED